MRGCCVGLNSFGHHAPVGRTRIRLVPSAGSNADVHDSPTARWCRCVSTTDSGETNVSPALAAEREGAEEEIAVLALAVGKRRCLRITRRWAKNDKTNFRTPYFLSTLPPRNSNQGCIIPHCRGGDNKWKCH